MSVVICLGQGGLRSLSASSSLFRIPVVNVTGHLQKMSSFCYRWLYNDPACRIAWTVFFACLCVTILSFMISTIHRYVTIVHNAHQLAIFATRWQPLLLGTLWIFGLISGVVLTVVGPIRALYWRDMCYIDNSELFWIGTGVFGALVVIPFICVPILYTKILRLIYKASKQVGNDKSQKSQNKGYRSAVVLFILFATFSVAFVPYCVRLILISIMSFETMKWTFVTTWFLATTVSTVNPILFMSLFKPIKTAFLETFCRRVESKNRIHVFVTAINQ